MALTWDLSKIKDYKTRCYRPVIPALGEGDLPAKEEYELSPVTHALLFISMGIGMGRITEKNWQQFWARTTVWERAVGAMLTKDGGPHYLTEDDVKEHIGLQTNVGQETKARFRKRVLEAVWDRNVPANIAPLL